MNQRRGTVLATLALVGLLTACSSTGSSDDSFAGAETSAESGSDAGSGGSVAEPAPADVPADASTGSGAGGARAGLAAPETERAVISTGTVSLRSSDVGRLLFDVQKAVDQYAGTLAERSSESDDDGEVLRSRLVVRVPAKSFGDLMGALEDTGTLLSSDSSSTDVTAQVIDTRVRVAAQKASLERVQALLARAQDLDDVVAIESQLTSRQADLDSLEQTQAYLADQTAQSTITVSLERTAEDLAPARDDSGFLAGLTSGWHALASLGTGLATVAGALVPFAVLLGLLGVPGLALARRLRRRTTTGGAAAAGGSAP